MNLLKSIKFYVSLLVLLFIYSNVYAQDSVNSWNDIREIRLAKSVLKTVTSTYINKKENRFSDYLRLSFQPGIEHKGTIPTGFVTKELLLKFNVCNSADTASSIYFFPGFFYNDIKLYKISNGVISEIPPVLPPVSDSIGFRLISLAAHDSISVIARLSFVKTYINVIKPRLVQPQYTAAFMAELRSNYSQDNVVTYIFCGLLMMMILFSLANFFQGASPEFLYYSGYAFFLGSMLLTKAVFDYRASYINFFFESYLDFIFQGIGIIFYMIFMQRFLYTKERHPFLYKLYNTSIGLLIISLLSYTFLHYFTNNFTIENAVENITKLLLLVMVIIFLVYSLRHWNDKLLRFLFWGNFFLFIFSLISQVNVMLDDLFQNLPGVFRSSLFYYEAGLFLELVFFLAGLNYKNKGNIIAQTKEREMLKAQNKLKEYEKEIAVYKAQQQERERISADMHDELGSGMTAIRLMSEITRKKMKENTPVEIDKISASANEVLDKMNVIIWSMNSGNDTIDNLVSYIRAYCLEYFENTPVQCKITTPEETDTREISGDKRRNVFLCIKETLNNALKHSGASLVTISIEARAVLRIEIVDNGKGIDMQELRQFGNGLKNMSTRMKSIGGTYEIENRNGTITTLEVPV
jgi:signal transduction histidine kinase